MDREPETPLAVDQNGDRWLNLPRYLQDIYGVSPAQSHQDCAGAEIHINDVPWTDGLNVPFSVVEGRRLEIRRADGLKTYRGVVRG